MNEAEARQIIEAYFNAVATGEDSAVFASYFAPDGVLEDPVGTPPLRAREAIIQFLDAARSKLERTDLTVREIISCGAESAVRWSGELFTKRGERISLEGMGVFSFDEQHKLRHVREFYDVKKLQAIFA